MQLKTPSGRTIDPNNISCVLRGIMVAMVEGTLVQLKTGEEVFLENSDEEVVEQIIQALKSFEAGN